MCDAQTPPPVGFVRHVIRQDPIRIEREGSAWRVWGRRPERAVATTDMDNEEAVVRLQRRLISMGVERLLSETGASAGDEVRIGGIAFDFEPTSSRRSIINQHFGYVSGARRSLARTAP